jgi:hypothetical protein
LINNPHENPAIKDKKRIQQAMVQGNFMIGDSKNRTLKNVETSYKPAVISEVAKDETSSPKDLKQHLNVSVTLGSHP